MLVIYIILIVWLAVLTHLIIRGGVSWPFLILSIVCWNLILAIWCALKPEANK